MEDPFDLLMLQEVGGFSDVPEGEWRTDGLNISGCDYRLFIYQSPLAHRCTAVLIREDLDLQVFSRHPFSTGFVLQCKSEGRNFWLGTAHLAHQQRRDAEDVWLGDLAKIDEILAQSRHHDFVLLGMDANQNLLNSNPCFAALSRLQLLVRHRSLEFNAYCGDTWVARGEASTIDWLLVRWPMIECAYHLREDLRLALPSDHNPLIGRFTGRRGLRNSHRGLSMVVVDGPLTVPGLKLRQWTPPSSFHRTPSRPSARNIPHACPPADIETPHLSSTSYVNVRSARTLESGHV